MQQTAEAEASTGQTAARESSLVVYREEEGGRFGLETSAFKGCVCVCALPSAHSALARVQQRSQKIYLSDGKIST